MIEACTRHGYAATTVRELAALAGVSTKTVYDNFDSKDACFLATYDLVVQQAVGRISAAYRDGPRGGDDWTAGLCRAFEAFATELVERPAPSRLALIEILAAAPDALPRITRAETLFTTMIAGSFARAPDSLLIPAPVVRALIGGIWFVARARLLESRPQVIRAGGAELREWLMAYRLPAGFRLPSAPALRPTPTIEAKLIETARSERFRMLRAAAKMVARDGYAALSPAGVAEAAGLSVAAFDAEFEDGRACFLSMLEWLSADAFAEALRESEGAPSWASSICRALRSLFRRVARDHALARAAFVDALVVGPVGYERRVAIMAAFAETFAHRAPARWRPSPLVAEAIIGSVWSIAHRQVVLGQRERLPSSWPLAAFVASAPIIGKDAALAVVASERECVKNN
jgi:AcrR family transcriptional regulator